MSGPTIIAVDWSGARRPSDQRRGIWTAVVRHGRVVETGGGRTREQTVERVMAEPGRVLAGFDFSFSLPLWFTRERGCTTIDDVWALAARDGETWLRPDPPFWRIRCDVPPERRFRRCEARLRRQGNAPKSVFQLVGDGQVGAGSVRAMPLLARMRAGGFAIWPFDAVGDRTAIEIYPSALNGTKGSNQQDAEGAALAMWAHRRDLCRLPAASDPTVRLEGDVWLPFDMRR